MDIEDSSIGWEALSILQLNLNKDSGQVLKENQTAIIYGDAWSTRIEDPLNPGKYIIKGTDIEGKARAVQTIPALDFKLTIPASEMGGESKLIHYKTKGYSYSYYPICLFSNKQINISTSDKSDVVSYDDYGNITYADISVGNYNYSSSPLSASTTSTGGIILSIVPPEGSETATNSVIYPIKFLPGNYITRLTSSSSEITSLYVHFLC